MYRRSTKLKKTLTNDRTFEVLEIVGLSSEPLSSYHIATIWGQKYSAYRKAQPNIKHIYEVVKRLYKPGHLTHSERFLAISYKRNVEDEILALERKFDLLQEKPGETRSRTMTPQEDREFTYALFRKDSLKKNRRNWRYNLNLKGLLLYLYNAREYTREPKTIHRVFSNVANRKIAIMDMRFLHNFEIFSRLYSIKVLVEILTQIAFELKDMISTMTPNFLMEYVLIRCYEEIMIDLSVSSNFLLKATKRTDEVKIRELRIYLVKVLKELIPIQRERLREMEEELKIAEEGIT